MTPCPKLSCKLLVESWSLQNTPPVFLWTFHDFQRRFSNHFSTGTKPRWKLTNPDWSHLRNRITRLVVAATIYHIHNISMRFSMVNPCTTVHIYTYIIYIYTILCEYRYVTLWNKQFGCRCLLEGNVVSLVLKSSATRTPYVLRTSWT